jgi:hypothetical protein
MKYIIPYLQGREGYQFHVTIGTFDEFGWTKKTY